MNAPLKTSSNSGVADFSGKAIRQHAAYLTASVDALRRHGGGRVYFEDDEFDVYAHACLEAYRATVGMPTISRRVRILELFAEQALVRLSPDERIVGSQRFCRLGFPPEIGQELGALGYGQSSGHIVHDYAALMEQGIGRLMRNVVERPSAGLPADGRAVLDAYRRALVAFGRFILRHAEAAACLAGSLPPAEAQEWRTWAAALRRLADGGRPSSFREALQMAWFAQIFLHAENPSAAISFGRLDQGLWPFLKHDLSAGVIDRTGARNLVASFCIQCCAGDESQNLTVGGVDADGRDAGNPLSILFLDVVRELRLIQPSLCVRLHPAAAHDLIDAACALASSGTGQPGFINDDAAIPGLMELGIPVGRARDYGIVGCYEATTQGDCYPNTVGGGSITLSKLLIEHLASDASRVHNSFRDFFESYLARVASAYAAALSSHFQPTWNYWRDVAPSPFGSVLMGGCVAAAQPLEAGGATYSLFGVNILGLGTTVDSLHAIEALVFGSQEISLPEIAAAVTADFPDEALRRRLLAVPSRYGTDAEPTNRLAAELSARVARMVLDSRMEHGVRPYPGFFRWSADIEDHPYATPDGRRAADNLSYGCGPSSACGGTTTAILASASHVAHTLCANGNPLALSLPEKDIRGPDGVKLIKALLLVYFNRGGFHIHFNSVDAGQLREAKAAPEQHGNLSIRMSGLSAKFVALSGNVQDALIERSERGV